MTQLLAPVTLEDLMCATSVAVLQIARKISRARNTDHGGVSNRGLRERMADGVHGYLGEIGLSRILGVPWTPGSVRVSRGDLGNRIEVRATEHMGGHLLIYPDDNAASTFVLMIGHYPCFRVAGHMPGFLAKDDQWWRSDADPPCWWVPQSALASIPAGWIEQRDAA